MITSQQLRIMAREKSLPLDMLEKDYVLGWVLFGVLKTSISENLVFKGGTSLSKIHFPWEWRLSEDLDFTVINTNNWEGIIQSLEFEVSNILNEKGMNVSLKDDIHKNEEYLQAKLGYQGPVSKGTIKIEITREPFLGDTISKLAPLMYPDYPEFNVVVYSIENILAEKIRAIIQRGKIRDYYDVWRLLGENSFNKDNVNFLFSNKCKAKKVKFKDVKQLFPDGLEQQLRPHLNTLTRLKPSKLPELSTMLKEARASLDSLLN
jgi:uncharacterized protein